MLSKNLVRFLLLGTTLSTLSLIRHPSLSKSRSSLAAWSIGNDSSLLIRTSLTANPKAFFQSSDGKKGDRIWIDFKGEPQRNRSFRGGRVIKEVRIGKPKSGFTRLVIEFNSSFSIDPNKLKLVGISEDKWKLKFYGIPSSDFKNLGEGTLIKSKSSYKSQSNKRINTRGKSVYLSKLPSLPRGLFTVVIDPGHGGPDSGAVGIGGLKETDIVLDISLLVHDILKSKGIKVFLTRSRDIDLDLPPRVSMANRLDADIFVSIHANASRRAKRSVNGIETFYYTGRKGYKLANSIQKELINITTKTPDRGVRKSGFYVIRRTKMPAVLVETGFVTGRLDASKLKNYSHRRKLAYAISKGIIYYLKGEL